jgi:hypothetical protein
VPMIRKLNFKSLFLNYLGKYKKKNKISMKYNEDKDNFLIIGLL